VRREYLPKELQAALAAPPEVLPVWDPMRGL
jgi:aminopeptidase C